MATVAEVSPTQLTVAVVAAVSALIWVMKSMQRQSDKTTTALLGQARDDRQQTFELFKLMHGDHMSVAEKMAEAIDKQAENTGALARAVDDMRLVNVQVAETQADGNRKLVQVLESQTRNMDEARRTMACRAPKTKPE